MPRKLLTFAEFRASGRDVADVRRLLPDQYDARTPGRIYAGQLVIEDSQGASSGRWMLTISNGSRCSNQLKTLERELYDWGVAEERIPAPRRARGGKR